MTDQQMKDRKLMTDLWYLLRDYGDLTNAPEDAGRWHEYVEKSNELRKNHPEARRLFIDLDIMLEIRGRNTNKSDLKIAC